MNRILLLLIISLAACSPIEKQATLQQRVGVVLNAGLGAVMIQIDRTRNLENAFGASDVFGRKTDEGFSQLRFAGMQGNTASFIRRDLQVRSNETTMSRSGGVFIPNTTTTTYSGAVGSTPVYGSATTSGGGTYIPAPKANTSSSVHDISFSVDLSTTSQFVFEGHQILVVEASPAGITYRID